MRSRFSRTRYWGWKVWTNLSETDDPLPLSYETPLHRSDALWFAEKRRLYRLLWVVALSVAVPTSWCFIGVKWAQWREGTSMLEGLPRSALYEAIFMEGPALILTVLLAGIAVVTMGYVLRRRWRARWLWLLPVIAVIWYVDLLFLAIYCDDPFP